MLANSIVCDSSVIRGMSKDPRNICYHYRHHLTGKQVYHCELSYPEVVEGLIRDLRMSRERAEAFFARWEGEFNSEGLPPTRKGKYLVLKEYQCKHHTTETSCSLKSSAKMN